MNPYFEAASAVERASGPASEELWDQYRKWREIIASTNLSALLDVILAREPAATICEISAQAEILARHGGRYDRDSRLLIPDRHKNQVKALLEHWVELLCGSPSGNRYVMIRSAFLGASRASKRRSGTRGIMKRSSVLSALVRTRRPLMCLSALARCFLI